MEMEVVEEEVVVVVWVSPPPEPWLHLESASCGVCRSSAGAGWMAVTVSATQEVLITAATAASTSGN